MADESTVNPAAFRLDHVAIAVKDLQEALGFYRDVLGMPIGGTERVEDQAVDVAFVGEEPGRIELICPFKPDTGVARFLEKKGEGLHHIAVRVHDIDAAVASLKAKGVPLIDQEPRTGAHGTRVAFVHPKGARGVLLELVQVPTHGHP
jgi:methylmalonyl-CoA epimerase